ncbi:hypothetical protein C8R41DRAFT_870298 [Lentinula lateritia]|uniref:Uncharacterized protein n=1 Tax=Lentinula lateritia TaxID=40482 RepID=A0ABQ8V475_9AGAR|nr:hypothetical protein C8R41DRAFT_870298 [Lentinula lateritia]
METLTASIDSNDPRLLAEAEVDLTFRLGRNPLSYYSDTFERCTRWTFEFKSSGLPFKPCLIGIISKFMCKEFDLGNGLKVYPVLQLVYPNKLGNMLSATFFNQLQVLNDQIGEDLHAISATGTYMGQHEQVDSWSTGPVNMSTNGCTIFVFIHRDAILTGVEASSMLDDLFLVDDVARIVKDRFCDN